MLAQYVTSLLLGLTLGSIRGGPSSLISNLRQADGRHLLWAFLAGLVFDLANLLLVAAIEYASLSVAFPVGVGVALVQGVLLINLLAPKGSPVLLFGGLLLVVMPIVLDAHAYRLREIVRPKTTGKGIVISLACGVLLACSTRSQQNHSPSQTLSDHLRLFL